VLEDGIPAPQHSGGRSDLSGQSAHAPGVACRDGPGSVEPTTGDGRRRRRGRRAAARLQRRVRYPDPRRGGPRGPAAGPAGCGRHVGDPRRDATGRGGADHVATERVVCRAGRPARRAVRGAPSARPTHRFGRGRSPGDDGAIERSRADRDQRRRARRRRSTLLRAPPGSARRSRAPRNGRSTTSRSSRPEARRVRASFISAHPRRRTAHGATPSRRPPRWRRPRRARASRDRRPHPGGRAPRPSRPIRRP